MKAKISIIGCGWLGLPLAKHLIDRGYTIKGSTTSEGKLETIKKAGIEPFLVKLNKDQLDGNANSFLLSDILIINIPPRRSSENIEDYPLSIELLMNLVSNSTIKKVIFISSTSVYEPTGKIITEDTEANACKASGQALIASENIVKNLSRDYILLRMAGLIGPERFPGRFLSGKTNLKNPDSPVNLIHLDDCVSIISSIIEKNIWNQTLNAAANSHPSRREYYCKAAEEQGFANPVFSNEQTDLPKVISNEKLKKILNYEFIHDVYYWR